MTGARTRTSRTRALEQLRGEALGCRPCPLWRDATQTVFGEGPAGANILLIVIAVVVILGGGVYAVAMRLRAKQLSPEGDRAEHPTPREQREQAAAPGGRRPRHTQVDSEQHTRFVGSR